MHHWRLSAIVFLWLGLTALGHAEPQTVTGQVLLPDGRPAPGARVIAVTLTGALHARQVEVRLDATGHFTCTAEQDGMSQTSLVALQAGLAPDWTTIAYGGLILRFGAKVETLTGQVTDLAGQPVPAAQVRVALLERPVPGTEESHFAALGDSGLLQATCDAAGRFALPGLPAEPGLEVTLEAAAPGYSFLFTRESASPGDPPPHLVLEPEATLAGRVTHDGQPVAGVRVEVVSGMGGFQYPREAEAVSGEDGSFLFAGLGGSTYHLFARDLPPGLTCPLIGAVNLIPGEHLTGCDFHLTPGALVSGTFCDAAGHPLPGVPVTADNGSWIFGEIEAAPVTLTDATGAYQVRLAPGSYGLGPPWRKQPENLAGFTVVPRLTGVTLREGETRTGVDFVLRPLPRVHGQVLLPSGTPAPGVGVKASMGGDAAVTDAGGAFALPPTDWFRPPSFGLYFVVASDEAGTLAGMSEVPDPDAPVTIRLHPAGWITAQVLDQAGKPVPGVTLEAQSILRFWRIFPGSATSDAQGRLRLGPLPPGFDLTPEIRARLASGRYGYLDPVRLQPGETRSLGALRVQAGSVSGAPYARPLFPPSKLRVGIVDPQGRPVPGALVFAFQQVHPYVADAQGGVDLTVPEGRGGNLRLLAVHPTEPLFAVLDDQRLAPDHHVRLAATGSAVGRIVDAAGQPCPGLLVQASYHHRFWSDTSAFTSHLRQAGWQGTVRTDAQGLWRLDGLLPGLDWTVQVLASGPGQPANWEADWSVELWPLRYMGEAPWPGGTVDLGTLTFDLAPRSGEVVDTAGQPVPEATVSVDMLRLAPPTGFPSERVIPAGGPQPATKPSKPRKPPSARRSVPMLPSPQPPTPAWTFGFPRNGRSGAVFVCDEAGRYSLPPVPAEYEVSVTVSAPGFAGVSATLAPGATSGKIVLPPEATISGRVTRDGRPVAGMSVTTAAPDMPSFPAPGGPVSAPDGTYTLRSLGAGTYQVRVNFPPWDVVSTPVSVTVTAGEHRTGCDLALTPGALVSGQVTDAVTHQPVSGGYVAWEYPDSEWRSNYDMEQQMYVGADGTYQLRLAPGKYRLSTWGFEDYADSAEVLVEVKEGEMRGGVDFVLVRRPPPGATSPWRGGMPKQGR